MLFETILASATVTEDVSGSAVALGVDLKAMKYVLVVAGVAGTDPSLDVTIEDDNGNFIKFPTVDAPGVWTIVAKSNTGNRTAVLDVTDGADPEGEGYVAPEFTGVAVYRAS